MYTVSQSSPDMCTIVCLYVYVICDLKLCLNCVELETGAAGAAGARLIPRGEVKEVSITFGC
jgi:hypothetical protein